MSVGRCTTCLIVDWIDYHPLLSCSPWHSCRICFLIKAIAQNPALQQYHVIKWSVTWSNIETELLRAGRSWDGQQMWKTTVFPSNVQDILGLPCSLAFPGGPSAHSLRSMDPGQYKFSSQCLIQDDVQRKIHSCIWQVFIECCSPPNARLAARYKSTQFLIQEP